MHCNGYKLNWKKFDEKLADKDYTKYLTNCLPMSLTGGAIGLFGKSLTFVINDPIPVMPVNELSIASGSKNIKLAAGEALDLNKALEIEAKDVGIDGLDGSGPAPCYGFNDDIHGDWVVCDKDGKEDITGSSITVNDGHIMTAGQVELTGELKAEFNEVVKLNALDVKVLDKAGAAVTVYDRPLVWRVNGEESTPDYKATVPGAHKVTVVYGGVESNAVVGKRKAC